MNRIDIMVDLETLGLKDNATVFQVSAVMFDISNGKIKSGFNKIIDIEKEDMVVDGSTIKWWLKTDKELLDKLINDDNSLPASSVWQLFNSWISCEVGNNDLSSKNVYLWGNGILFDNQKVKTQMEKFGIKYPIHYTNDRDVRTILDLACDKTSFSCDKIKASVSDESETKHDALDDCRYQVRLVSFCYDILMKAIAVVAE